MAKNWAGWRSATAIAVGAAMVSLSTIVTLVTGQDASVPIVVGGALLSGGLMSGVLPQQWLERWLDRVKSVEAQGAGLRAKVELGDVSDAKAGIAAIQHELEQVPSVDAAVLRDQIERVAKSIDRLTSATVEQVLARFTTRYLTRWSNPNQTYPAPSQSWHIWITGAGAWQSDLVPFYTLIARIEGPGGYQRVTEIPQEMNGPDNWFQWTTYVDDAPEGAHTARWYLRDAAGDEVLFRTDTFSVPSATPYSDELRGIRI